MTRDEQKEVATESARTQNLRRNFYIANSTLGFAFFFACPIGLFVTLNKYHQDTITSDSFWFDFPILVLLWFNSFLMLAAAYYQYKKKISLPKLMTPTIIWLVVITLANFFD